jgi:hypothetical protein
VERREREGVVKRGLVNIK